MPIKQVWPGHLKNLIEKAQRRKEMALTPAHDLANLLDPLYRGESLSDNELQKGLQFGKVNFPGMAIDLLKYRANAAPFHQFFFEEKCCGISLTSSLVGVLFEQH